MSQTPPTAPDALPTAPSTSDTANFDSRADAFVAAQQPWADQLYAMAMNAYNNAVDCFNNAVAALASKNAAATSEANAQSYAASSAASAGATVWVSGTAYPQYAAVFSPATLRAYRHITTSGASATDPSADPTNWTPELPKQLPYAHFLDQKASGTSGATLTNATFNTRELQTTVYNDITGASLSSNQITLPAGTYEVDGWLSLTTTGQSGQSHLYNVTDSAVLVPSGNSSSSTSNARSTFGGKFTIAATKVIALRTWPGISGGSPGAGGPATTGQPEVYASIRIKKVA